MKQALAVYAREGRLPVLVCGEDAYELYCGHDMFTGGWLHPSFFSPSDFCAPEAGSTSLYLGTNQPVGVMNEFMVS